MPRTRPDAQPPVHPAPHAGSMPHLAPVVAVLAAVLAGACGGRPEPRVFRTAGGEQMIVVDGGVFAMGSRSGDADEAPVHSVTVSPFLIDRCEVTQAMFARLQLSNPSRCKGNDLPVDNVTWVLAVQFCNDRSRAEGLEPCYDDAAVCDFAKNGYRLPTEAEWEYACRAGGTGDYDFGDDTGRLREHAWYADNSGGRTQPVGRKAANAWGIHDLHGNVAEWCNDVYDAGWYPRTPLVDPRGPEPADDGADRMYVVRGGSWNHGAAALRCAARGRDRPGFGDACLAPDTIGLRCVRRMPGAAR